MIVIVLEVMVVRGMRMGATVLEMVEVVDMVLEVMAQLVEVEEVLEQVVDVDVVRWMC